MPVLTVDSLHCLQDTSEWSADEVYLLVLTACLSPDLRLAVKTLAARDWQSLSAGVRRASDALVDRDFAADGIALAVLLEQDGARDLDLDACRKSLEQDLQVAFGAFASILSVTRTELADQLRVQLDQSIPKLLGNDHAVGRAAALDFSGNGKTAELLLHGPKGRYHLVFKLA